MQTLIWFGAAALLVACLSTIGLAVAALIHRQGMSPGEDLMVALFGGIAVTALAAVVQLPLPFSYTAASPPLMVLLLAGSAVVLWRRRDWLRTMPKDPQVQLMTAALLGLFAIGLVVGALPWDTPTVQGAGAVWSVHVPNMPGDALLQYRTAQVLQNRLPIQTTPFYINYWYISDRTPLVGLMTTFLTSSAGIGLPKDLETLSVPFRLVDPYGYWLYRQISMFTNAMVVVSSILLAWEMLSARAARLGAVFILLSPFVLINIMFHWPKLLAGFFVVGFYFWSYVRRRPLLAGIFAAGGVLSHPVGALFIPGMLVYLLVARRWRQLLTSGAAAAFVALPWFLWTSFVYHHTSRMITYPIGFALANPTNPGPEILDDLRNFIHRPISSILGDRWVTIRNTLTTWPFPLERNLHDLANPIYEVFRTTFPGIFGVALAVFGYLSWKRIATQAFWAATLGASTVCIFLFWGFTPRAIAQEAFQPIAGIWICLAAALLAALPRWVVRTAVAISVVEWIAFTYQLLLRTPPLHAWQLSWAVLFVLSLSLIVGVGAAGWTASDTKPTDSSPPTSPIAELAHN